MNSTNYFSEFFRGNPKVLSPVAWRIGADTHEALVFTDEVVTGLALLSSFAASLPALVKVRMFKNKARMGYSRRVEEGVQVSCAYALWCSVLSA
jgi:hypothetical protein